MPPGQQEPLAQLGFDPDSDDVRADLTDPCKKGPPGNKKQDQLQPWQDIAKGLTLQMDGVDRAAEKVSLPDRQQTACKSGKNRDEKWSAGVTGEGEKSAMHG